MKPTWKVLQGDARDLDIPSQSVHAIALSVPYWGLRKYLDHPNEIGCEDKLEQWIANLIECGREWRRVLRDDGTLWINCGDTYASSGGSRTEGSHDGRTGRGPSVAGNRIPPDGFKAKDLIGLPWRLAFALQADGWYLRNEICWAKGVDWLPNEQDAQDQILEALETVRAEAQNSLFGLSKDLENALRRAQKAVASIQTTGPSMPESMIDRCAVSHEKLFVFSKSPQYFFDQMAIKVPPNNRNHRSVWLLWRCNTEPQGAFVLPDGREISHFAAWPSRLAHRIIKAAVSRAGVCATCGAPFVRVIRKSTGGPQRSRDAKGDGRPDARGYMTGAGQAWQDWKEAHPDETIGWEPTCTCHGEPHSGRVPCEKCRGTGRQRRALDYEGKRAIEDPGAAARRLSANTRAARMGGAPHDIAFSDPTIVYTGPPCPACLCPDCQGTGKRMAYVRGGQPSKEAYPVGAPQRKGKKIDGVTVFAPKQPTDEPCPTCEGVGALGYTQGPVWDQDVLDSWPIVPATILDPMAGSGTTGRTALGMGVSVIINDLSPEYCDLSRARLEAFPGDVPTKKSGNQNGTMLPLPLFEEMGL